MSSSPISSMASSSATTISKSRVALPSRNACLSCRAQKTRCIALEGSEKCARCFRHDLECVHKQHCRGPKRKYPQQLQGEPIIKRQSYSPSPTTSSDVSQSPGSLGFSQSNERTVLPVERPEPTSYSLDTILSGSRADDCVKDIVEEYSDFFEDPVALNMLSERKAEKLFDYFHENMNCCLALFDPVLHTAHYVKRASSLLFTAILAVSSKFAFRDIYVPCLKLAHARLSSACINGPPKVEVIQAICVLTFWKEPSDQNSWRRIGVSIRMAFELGLHHPQQRPLSDDEPAARKVLDRERTWFHLQNFDRTTSYQRDLPHMISPEWTRDALQWLSSYPERLRILPDYMICASLTVADIKRRTRQVHKALNRIRSIIQNDEARSRGGANAIATRVIEHQILEQTLMITDLKSDLENWKRKWLASTTSFEIPNHIQAKFEFMGAVIALNLAITTFEHDLLKESMSDQPGLEKVNHGPCVAACLSLLATVNDLATSGILQYTQDSIAVGFATAILWLSLHCNLFDNQTIRIVDRALQETKRQAAASSKQPKDAPAYFARFIENFGQTFSRARSRISSPEPTIPYTNADEDGHRSHNGTHQMSNANHAPNTSTSYSMAPNTSVNGIFPWDQPLSQQQQMSSSGHIPTTDAAQQDLMSTRQSLDFFSMSMDQTYWTALAPQIGLQNYLQSAPQQDVFSQATASQLSSHLGW